MTERRVHIDKRGRPPKLSEAHRARVRASEWMSKRVAKGDVIYRGPAPSVEEPRVIGSLTQPQLTALHRLRVEVEYCSGSKGLRGAWSPGENAALDLFSTKRRVAAAINAVGPSAAVVLLRWIVSGILDERGDDAFRAALDLLVKHYEATIRR